MQGVSVFSALVFWRQRAQQQSKNVTSVFAENLAVCEPGGSSSEAVIPWVIRSTFPRIIFVLIG